MSLLSLYDCKIEISCISPYPLQLLAGAVVGTVPAKMYNQITAIHTHPEHPQFWLHRDSPRFSCRDTCSRVWPQDLVETSPPRCRKALESTNVARAAVRLIREAAAGRIPRLPQRRAGQDRASSDTEHPLLGKPWRRANPPVTQPSRAPAGGFPSHRVAPGRKEGAARLAAGMGAHPLVWYHGAPVNSRRTQTVQHCQSVVYRRPAT